MENVEKSGKIFWKTLYKKKFNKYEEKRYKGLRMRKFSKRGEKRSKGFCFKNFKKKFDKDEVIYIFSYPHIL